MAFSAFADRLARSQTALANAVKGIGLNVSAQVKAADALNRAQKWSEAAAAYERVLKVAPGLAHLWVQLGHCRKEMRAFEAAEQAYRKAVEADPAHGDAYFHLAYLLRDRGDRGGAFAAFRSAWKHEGIPRALMELSDLIGSKAPYEDIEAAMAELFDPAYYLTTNPDVAHGGVDPAVHYLVYGWRENRAPSRWFDPYYYQAHHGRKIPKGEMPLMHFVLEGRPAGHRGNPVGNKPWFVPKAPTAEDWAAVKPARLGPATRAVVILPVYKGYDETLASVYHALAGRGGANYSLLVINDRGPDAALNATLGELAAKGLFDYHVNGANLGFVQTINHGLNHLSADKDVVLLNSDAYVFPGWFDRLVAHADRDPRVATVTPLSNNATLCSYPLIDRDNAIALEQSPAEIDALAATVNAGFAVDTPTGVGFCFFMRRSVIDAIGGLDHDSFKVGYGEENDFCLRSMAAGYRNLVAGDVFVFHIGSVSFSAIKEANFNAGQTALIGKHPNYPDLTRRHMSADPGRIGRRRLDLARLAAAIEDVTVFVTHAWSGGIETYLAGVTEELEAEGRPYIYLRVHDRNFVSLETDPKQGLFVPNLTSIDLRLEGGFVAEILASLRIREVHVNSFAGLDWTAHRKMLRIIGDCGKPYRYVGHDYSAVSYNYQLIRPDGLYEELPDVERLVAWSRMRVEDHLDLCDPRERIEAYTPFLAGATRVETPSTAAARVLQRYYPDVAIDVVPHADHIPHVTPMARRVPDGRIRVAVVGAIGQHKGSDVLLAMARDAIWRKLPIDFSIVGYSNQDAAMIGAGVSVTGAYRGEYEAVGLLNEIAPDVIFIPSVWAETYCYTLSFPLHLGVPPVVFDLGAQAERVKACGIGICLDPHLIDTPGRINDLLLSTDLDALWARRTTATPMAAE